MKKLLVAIALIASTGFANAQTQKFGFINSMELISLMPETKTADMKLQGTAKGYEDQLKAMQKELESKYKVFQEGAAAMTDAIKEVKQGELESLNQRLTSLQQSAQDKISKEKETLYSPILKKADDAIQETAKANGYSYIFDTNSNAILYGPPNDNILPLVAKYLGITIPSANAPKTATAPKPAPKTK
jgi:outer membrane protein